MLPPFEFINNKLHFAKFSINVIIKWCRNTGSEIINEAKWTTPTNILKTKNVNIIRVIKGKSI